MRTARNAALLIVLVCIVAACARPYTTYVVTRQGYNEVLKEYLDWYDDQGAERQTYCKENIDPNFERATAALDAWGKSLALKDSWGARDAFLDIQEDLMRDLIRLYQGGE